MQTEYWFVIYRTEGSILYVHGDGNLLDWPKLPVEGEVFYAEVFCDDTLIHCFYSENIDEQSAVFMTQSAYYDGLFGA